MKFYNVKTQKNIELDTEYYTIKELTIILNRIDSDSVHESSVNHLVKGYRKRMGNWETVGVDIVPNQYNKTSRTQSSNTSSFSNLSMKQKYDKLQYTINHYKSVGNWKMVKTLEPMLLSYKAKSVKSSKGDDLNTHLSKTVRPCTNPRTMSIKMKREKYDTRIVV